MFEKQQLLNWLLSLGVASVAVGIPTAFIVKDVPRDLLYIQVAVGLIGALIGWALILRRNPSFLGVAILNSGFVFALVGMFSFFVSYGVAIALIGVAALFAYFLLKRQA